MVITFNTGSACAFISLNQSVHIFIKAKIKTDKIKTEREGKNDTIVLSLGPSDYIFVYIQLKKKNY